MGPRTVRMAIAGFLATLATACAGWSGPSLRPAGNPNASIGGFPKVNANHHALLGSMLLCLTGPGRAVITSVRPIHPAGSIEVLDYGVRPNPLPTGGEMVGTEYGSLRTHGFTANRTVDVPCGAENSGHGYELALELSVPLGTDAATTGWEIDYRIGDHRASTTFPQGAVLCSTASLDQNPCKHLAQQFGMS
jgi:hypothetical protein